MARPTLLAPLVLTALLTGCPLTHGDYATPSFVHDGVSFWWRAPVELGSDELRVVGEVEIEWFGETVRSTAWVPAGADPDGLLVVRQPASQGDGLAIFTAEGEAIPAELCRYFDPRVGETPQECQAPYTIELNGTIYELVVPGATEYALDIRATFHFEAADLTAIGIVDDLDPRLAAFKGVGIDPTAYAIRGVPQTAAVVLLYGGIDDLTAELAYTFAAAGMDHLPAELCARSGDIAEYLEPPEGCR